MCQWRLILLSAITFSVALNIFSFGEDGTLNDRRNIDILPETLSRGDHIPLQVIESPMDGADRLRNVQSALLEDVKVFHDSASNEHEVGSNNFNLLQARVFGSSLKRDVNSLVQIETESALGNADAKIRYILHEEGKNAVNKEIDATISLELDEENQIIDTNTSNKNLLHQNNDTVLNMIDAGSLMLNEDKLVIAENSTEKLDETALSENVTFSEKSASPILHVFQYGAARTATTTQFNMVCISLFLHVQLYRPELLNNTICNMADRWFGSNPRVVYFLQNEEIPQAVKSHVEEPPNLIRSSTVIFTTALMKDKAIKKEAELRERDFNVGLIQDMETFKEIGISGLVGQYAEYFKLTQGHVTMMTNYFNYWDKLRQCCGLQMSKNFRNELLPPDEKKSYLTKHKFCGSIDINGLEEQYMATDLYKLLDQYKLVRRINRVSLVDGNLNGTYCTRYNDAVQKYGITGNEQFAGLNSKYEEVENNWDEEVTPTFDALSHVLRKVESRNEALLQTDKSIESKTDSSSVDPPFSPWVQDYISFHQSSVVNGTLKDDARYIVYQCKDGRVDCGGVGDRVIGMIKMFYLAMITRRVLLIDADFPIPLTLVLDPAYIEWNATFPDTPEYFTDLIWRPKRNRFVMRLETRGYRILKTMGIPRKLALDDIWLSKLMAHHMEQNNWSEMANNMSLAAKACEAFRAMFKIGPAVLARAEEFKLSASITAPYIGIHMRKGDAAMGVGGPTSKKMSLTIDRTTDNNMMMTCLQEMKKAHPAISLVYLASDDVATKEKISDIDPSIHYAKGIKPFHVDLLARSNFSSTLKLNVADKSVFQGTIDTWAEMTLLSQSTCFIASKSMFSFGALYMRDPNDCVVFLERCELISHRKGQYSYYGEAIYERGFVVVENITGDS